MAHNINSHLPGIFYRRPSPEKEQYKKEGDAVQEGDVIGLVEVMKAFHEVRSPVNGTITKFLVENQKPVVAGQAIAEVE